MRTTFLLMVKLADKIIVTGSQYALCLTLKKLSPLTLYTLRVTYRFYSVWCQSILLVKGRYPLGLKRGNETFCVVHWRNRRSEVFVVKNTATGFIFTQYVIIAIYNETNTFENLEILVSSTSTFTILKNDKMVWNYYHDYSLNCTTRGPITGTN